MWYISFINKFIRSGCSGFNNTADKLRAGGVSSRDVILGARGVKGVTVWFYLILSVCLQRLLTVRPPHTDTRTVQILHFCYFANISWDKNTDAWTGRFTPMYCMCCKYGALMDTSSLRTPQHKQPIQEKNSTKSFQHMPSVHVKMKTGLCRSENITLP